ncbi:MAG TPA: hypothetical protein VM934_03170 [Pyrinomonadaceae bacterium]|jgi:hypothetical protein|nr:hypothetical protein [Pyrinomonadaceae bacterium]
MPKNTHSIFTNIELFIIRVASLALLVILLLKVLKGEISSW